MGEGLQGFLTLHGSHGSFDATANGVGYSTGTTGLTVGVEKALGESAAVGLSLGAVRGKADADLGRG